MKKIGIIFLQVVIIILGLSVLTFMLLEPHFEGRNVNATLFEIYFHDPFLACVYTVSIAFFVALYQAFKALGYVRENKTFSGETEKALRIIKYCGTILVGSVVAAIAYLMIVRPGDDIAGGVFMGLIVVVVSGVIAATAARFEKRLQNK